MLILNGEPILTHRFPNGETKVKDFEVLPNQNILELNYTNDADFITLVFVKLRIDEFGAPCTLLTWNVPNHPSSNWLINKLNFTGLIVMKPYPEQAGRQFLNHSTALTLNGKSIVMEQLPSGEIKAKNFKVLPDQNILELKYTCDADLFALLFVKLLIDKLGAPCTLIIRYMPYSRMDRKIEGDLFTLQYVCWLFNILNFSKVIVIEPHSEKTMELLDRAIDIYPVKDWLPLIMQKISFSENDHIVFPDKGAAARYKNSGYKNVCVFEKKRNPTTGQIVDIYLKEGSVNPGAKCIIIDDLCSKGGTFAWEGDILISLGASEVVLVVSHCEETIFKGKLLTPESPISAVFTSTSMMCKQHPKIHYMKVEVMNHDA